MHNLIPCLTLVSAGLLAHPYRMPSLPVTPESGVVSEFIYRLTAAGTAPDLHRIPYYSQLQNNRWNQNNAKVENYFYRTAKVFYGMYLIENRTLIKILKND